MPLAGGIFCPNFDLSAEPKAEGSSVKISLIETGEKRFKRFFFKLEHLFFVMKILKTDLLMKMLSKVLQSTTA